MAKYQFGAHIGGGGFGVVKEAVRVDDNWQCVAKFLKDHHTSDDLARFQREVRLQVQIDHRNIVPIAGQNLTADPPWFIMPRALSNLREYFGTHGVGEAHLWVFEEILEGIQHAHKQGVIHRDLKPENVLLYSEGQGLYAAVSDFGLGRLLERDTTTLTQNYIGMGTIEYMAPEQLRDAKNADERCDIFSLGKILYEVLTGEIPYPTMDFGQLPRKYIYIVQKATQNNPDERYQSVAALIDDLDLIATRSHEFASPADAARAMIRDLVEERSFEADDVEPLARFLSENADDYQMLVRVLPTIPAPILDKLVGEHLAVFKPVFEEYDNQIDNGVTFDYCDVIADFYEGVFNLTDDHDMHRTIVNRLTSLGPGYNRWHVGTVFGRVVGASVGDESMVLMVRDALARNKANALWNAKYLRDVSLPRQIRKILDDAGEDQ